MDILNVAVYLATLCFFSHCLVDAGESFGGKSLKWKSESTTKDTCDVSSDERQCSVNEICVNGICNRAEVCEEGDNCGPRDCVLGYCQPDPCKATGECVHGFVCAQDTPRSCVNPVPHVLTEGQSLILKFQENGSLYENLIWYKGRRGEDYRIASYIPSEDENNVIYYDDFCKFAPECHDSDKGNMDRYTGELEIKNLTVSDGGVYYYEFTSYDIRVEDTGIKYEFQLVIYVDPQGRITIDGLPHSLPDNELVQVDLSCKVSSINPAATAVYWTLDGNRNNGSLETVANSDGTSTHYNNATFYFRKVDNGKKLTCVVEPVYGETTSVTKIVNVEYAPEGTPDIVPERVTGSEGQLVILTCDTSSVDSNPKCSIRWEKTENTTDRFPVTYENTYTLEIHMDKSYGGFYTCRCMNPYGKSGISEMAEVVYSSARVSFGNLKFIFVIFVTIFCL